MVPDYELAARRAARKHGVNENVFVAQLRQESGLRPGLTSSAWAQGIAQFIPSTARAYGVNLGDGRVSDDLDGAARYMRDNLKRTGGNYRQALSIYNSGRADGYLQIDETKQYVKNIMAAAGTRQPTGGAARPDSSGGGAQQPAFDPGVPSGGALVQLAQRPVVQASAPAAPAFLAGVRLPKAYQAPSAGPAPKPGGGGVAELLAQVSSSANALPETQRPSQQPAESRAQSGGGLPSSGGLKGLIRSVQVTDRWAKSLGVPVTAKQEPGHAVGGDHDPRVKGASARDYGGSEQVRRALFTRLARELGVRGAVYKGADINVVRDGVRWQIISRDHGSGPHLHVGWRRV